MKAKTKAMPVGTGYVAELVARGEADMAAQQMPELKAVPGIDGGAAAAGASACHRVLGGRSAAPHDPGAANALVGIPVVAGCRGRAESQGPRSAVIVNPAGTPRRRTSRS